MKPTLFLRITLLSLAISFAFANTEQLKDSTCVFVDAEQSTNINTSNLTNSEQLKTSPPSCEASPIAIIFEHHYKGHPYRNVNVRRPKSDFDPTNLSYEYGKKSDYKIEQDRHGKGTYAQVFKATHIPTGDIVVVKVVHHRARIDVFKTLNEIKLLMELKDMPNYIPLRDIWKENQQGRPVFCLVFDYFETKKPFKDLIPELEGYQMKYFLYETLRSLDYVHSKGVIHKDMKPNNVLIDEENMKVKVIDFGLSESYLPGFTRTVMVGSLYYKGPELLLNYTMYDYAVDIWGLGTIFAEMMFKKINFFVSTVSYKPQANLEEELAHKQEIYKGQLEAIAQVLGSVKLKQYANRYKDVMNLDLMGLVKDYKKQPWTNFVTEENRHLYDPVGTDLLDKMLTYDHARRITAKEALQHPYFDEVRRNLVKEE